MLRTDQIREISAIGLEPEQLAAVLTILSRPAPQTIRNRRCIEKKRTAGTLHTVPNNVPKPVPTVQNVPTGVPKSVPSNTSTVDAKKGLPHTPSKENTTPVSFPKKENVTSPTRGKRLPEDWHPSLATFEAMKEEFGLEGSAVMACLPKFRDYWSATPGQKGCKLNWDATLRNWVRKEQESKPRPSTSGQGNGYYRPGERFVTSSGRVF